jgi:hypothetical protein
LAVGSWQLAVGSWQLAVGSWQLAVGYPKIQNLHLTTKIHMKICCLGAGFSF